MPSTCVDRYWNRDQPVLLRPGALPKTTSGKVQRRLTRELWRAGTLSTLPLAVE